MTQPAAVDRNPAEGQGEPALAHLAQGTRPWKATEDKEAATPRRGGGRIRVPRQGLEPRTY